MTQYFYLAPILKLSSDFSSIHQALFKIKVHCNCIQLHHSWCNLKKTIPPPPHTHTCIHAAWDHQMMIKHYDMIR